MNIDVLEKAGINYQEGLKRFAGKSALYEKYLLRFGQEPTFDQLKKAMAQEDYEEAFKAAHTMKGIVGNLSLNEFFELLKPFVEELRDQSDIPSAKMHMSTLIEEHDKLVEAIRQAE